MLGDYDFVVLDFETTGLDASRGDEITEIGAVRFRKPDLSDVRRFETFLKPSKPIPADAVEITGITNEMVAGAPRMEEVFDSFMEFMKGAIPIAQNAKFDMSFLFPHLEKHEYMSFSSYCLDTKLLSKKIWFYERGHNLDVILARLGIDYDSKARHRAVADCLMTAKAFVKLMERLNFEELGELKKYSVSVPKPEIQMQEVLPLF